MKTTAVPDSKTPLRILAVYAGVLIALCLFFATIAHLLRVNRPWDGFKAPDVTQAARELLLQKFSGPRYFQIVPDQDLPPGPNISVAHARAQVAEVVKVRQLPPEAAGKIEKLIEKLTVPPSSRVVGVDHVNVLQLNLALDELR